jgi:release factor glutamine methyltransferase
MSVGITIQEILLKTIQMLQVASDSPQLDAELLLSSVLGKSKEFFITHPQEKLKPTEEIKFNALVQRRIQGEPIAYILGHKEFWSLDLLVSHDVLIPRPETEHLIEWALQNLSTDSSLLIADLGVGSGSIALSLAVERPHWNIHATDASVKALVLARRNALAHQLFNVRYYWGDWCAALPSQQYHAIFSNPPYIASEDSHLPQLIKFEPKEALDGGNDGFDDIKIIISQSNDYLVSGGALILEHGYDQGEKIVELMRNADYQNVQDHFDLAGLSRFVTGWKPQ